MHKEIDIRQAIPADARQISSFNQNMAFETEGIRLESEVILAGTCRLIDNRNLGFYLVAECEREIVASLMVTTEWSDWRNGVFWWIQSVYVMPQWRRQGIYRRLYEKVKELAETDRDVCGYRLYVERENTTAQSTYRNVGMSQTHYRMYEELKADTRFIEPARAGTETLPDP